MTEINISIEELLNQEDKVVKIYKFQGQLDESNVDEKSKIIYAEIEKHPKKLNMIMDFEMLEYMNSKSIGFLTDWYSKVTEGEGKIVIAKAKANILDILEVVGLSQLITCYPSLEEAKMAIMGNNTPTTPSAQPTA